MIQVLDKDASLQEKGICPPLIVNVEDRLSLLRMTDHLRLSTGEGEEVRKTLYALLDANSEADIDPAEMLSGALLIEDTRIKSGDSQLGLAKKRTVELLKQYAQVV